MSLRANSDYSYLFILVLYLRFFAEHMMGRIEKVFEARSLITAHSIRIPACSQVKMDRFVVML